jgi:hypothetical protein
MVMVVIPITILAFTGLDTFDLWQSYPATRVALPVIGVLFVGLGLMLMVATIRLFVTVDKGTLAPWNPTVGGPQMSQCCKPRCCTTLSEKERKERHSPPNGRCTGHLQAGRLSLALESSA